MTQFILLDMCALFRYIFISLDIELHIIVNYLLKFQTKERMS
jgi:hypothetical protein